jgi:hypothetical protein
MDVTVAVTPQALSENLPDSTVVNVTFTVSNPPTQNGPTIYYSATISDNATPTPNTENVIFSHDLSQGDPIPTTITFPFLPTVEFTGDTLSGTNGKVYYTPST